TNFSDGIHEFQFSEPVKNLRILGSVKRLHRSHSGHSDLPLPVTEFFGDVDVKCKMDKSSHQIVLDCDILVHSKMICDRCATEYETNLTNHFQISYLFSREAIDSDEYNVKYISPEEDKINIKDDVYEYAELSIPLKKLCKENCKGLCPHCGKNLNEEKCNCKNETTRDVWQPLKNLLETAEEQKRKNKRNTSKARR
ncbi:MAG: DUF177 domain-containing protein, partial [Bacteroidota bacterium]